MKFFWNEDLIFEGTVSKGTELLDKITLKERIGALKNRSSAELFDLQTPLPEESSEWDLCGQKSLESLDLVRHTCAHVLAQAVKELFPETQVTIGPVIERGFYYDFAREEAFKEEDFPPIEKKMKEIIKARYPLERELWSVEQALSFFEEKGELYKCELIRDLQKEQGVEKVSVYKQGPFIDLCKGPHGAHTGTVAAFKLMSVAGAYWRGNEKNAMLSRIYGTAFHSKEELKKHLHLLEEAKKRDHRKIAVHQDLFSMHNEAPAAPFFHPRGAFLYRKLQECLRDLNDSYGFEEVMTPLILSEELWKASGHYENYRENMYFTESDERSFAVKPMNCPGHCLIYKNTRHSYKELPLRYSEFGRVHRHERSGVVGGLFRVRSFVQDDAHVYCTTEQVEPEILRILEMVRKFYGLFDFKYSIELSTRPEKYIGSLESWAQAETALKNALESAGASYELNPGDGAFYGPKIDFHLEDSLGRSHQCGTVQLDFSMPERFDLQYSGADNKSHRPVMIHRAIAGSLERFLGIFTEHVAGAFPFWMCPVQASILTVSEEALDFARNVFDELKSKGYRVHIDDSSDNLGAKIKKARSMRAPYTLIIGAQEASNQILSVRDLKGEQKKLALSELLPLWEQEERTSF